MARLTVAKRPPRTPPDADDGGLAGFDKGSSKTIGVAAATSVDAEKLHDDLSNDSADGRKWSISGLVRSRSARVVHPQDLELEPKSPSTRKHRSKKYSRRGESIDEQSLATVSTVANTTVATNDESEASPEKKKSRSSKRKKKMSPDRKKKTEEKKIIYGAIKTNPLFEGFSREELVDLVKAFKIQYVPKGSLVIREGGGCDRFYVLERGKVRVIEEGVGQCSMTAVIAFGEMSLKPSSVSVQATCDCKMWALDLKDFLEARAQHKLKILKELQIHGRPIEEILKPEDLLSMASVASIKKFKAGSTIVSQWQKGDAFYVVKDGTVDVRQREKGSNAIASLEKGSYFGEKSLFSACVTNATCTASTDVTCLEVTREDFVPILGHLPNIFDKNYASRVEALEARHETFLEKEAQPEPKPARKFWFLGQRSSKKMSKKDKMLLDQKVEFLKTVNIHGNELENILEPSELEAMALATKTKKYKAGETIVLQWDKGDAFYMIEEGTVEVFVKEKGDKPVATLESGSFFGERAMLSTVVTVATCRAATDVTCFVLKREDFMEMLGDKQVFEKSFEGRAEAMQAWQESFLQNQPQEETPPDQSDHGTRRVPRWLAAACAFGLVCLVAAAALVLI